MNLFDKISRQFKKPTGFGGKLSTFLMNVINRKQSKTTEKSLNLSDGERVLDIGFGNGLLLSRLIKRYKCKFFGIDISEDMVKTAAKKCPKAKLSMGDVSKIDFEDCFFDKIYTVNTVYFWSNLDVCLTEIYRILKSGGVFVNAVKSKELLEKLPITRYNFAKYTLDELVNASKKNGFSVEIQSISKGKEFCIICKKV
jgi:ubiquinone/menaquinone biosynthesis C-methylase UbiE